MPVRTSSTNDVWATGCGMGAERAVVELEAEEVGFLESYWRNGAPPLETAVAFPIENYPGVIDTYDQVAPGFKASITHRDVVGPHQMEQEYGLVGGNIFHGELSLEQLFHMRPAPGYADYRTPIAGLYNGSSATHAGGGVCGIPGWQASRAALADKKRGMRRFRRSR